MIRTTAPSTFGIAQPDAWRTAAAVALAALLSACGGGTDGTGRVPGDNAVTSSGVMTRGSVILNDTSFDATGARVTDDRGRGTAALDSGMVIKLRGTRNANGNGRADEIDVENELRAPVASIDATASPQRFVAAGVTVLVDSTTVYANVAGFSALAAGMRVEVHGLRDADGWLRAARIEAVGVDGADELRARITALDTATRRFTLGGNVTVDYAGAGFAPAGAGEAALASGALVEVRGVLASPTTFVATQVDIESLEDAGYDARPSEAQHVEGFVTGFVALPGEFLVNGHRVRSTSATRFVSGTATDLADNVQVAAEGAVDAQGVLVAASIKFKRSRVVLQGLATAVDLPARTLALLGQTVQTNDITRFIGAPQIGLGDIVPGTHCVDVRGYVDGARILAERVRRQHNCTRDLVQARVTAKDGTLFTLAFFGTLTAATGPATQYLDASDLPLAREAFFAAVTPAGAASAGSLVRVQGTWAAGALAVEQAELKE
jgi:hypothetical protein